ncbi:hypothetical protein OG349_34750 [Streptomyces sp. NBC_01317]|uniref:hypothetical protein n=1 Tax=Streptomyces sp. NBC_01317 TaxID=2903822 RepID=UPI002E13CB71|nr:hypothetical protein OG349_00020 [Streptomyces sp. NBC_01317]WSJ47689.1 hypothetical protein OG349_34750 [Streptomyces sp. NBC_01317]
MNRIKRIFFALDRRFAGHLPPSEGRKRAVRHPLPFGFVGAVFFGGQPTWVMGRIELSIVLYALVMGVLVSLGVILERKRMIHYGFLPRPDRPATRR